MGVLNGTYPFWSLDDQHTAGGKAILSDRPISPIAIIMMHEFTIMLWLSTYDHEPQTDELRRSRMFFPFVF